jgi:mannose-6-phosphate isomerase-like protein (cupin superfamily)
MIIADISEPSSVFGVHGAEGLTYWKCLARRAGTAASWEAVEWASLPPGGVSGAHAHTRTEEIYLVLSGTGQLTLDDTVYRVSPGALVLTRAGSVHGLRNAADSDLDWLVVEMNTPATQEVLRTGAGPSPIDPTRSRRMSKVYDLTQTPRIDPAEVFDGPVEVIRTLTVPAHSEEHFTADGAEHVLFVLDGSGQARSSAANAPITAGTALTLPLGGHVTLHAAGDGLRLFHVALRVPGPAQDAR